MGHDIYGAKSKSHFEEAILAGRYGDPTRYPWSRPAEFPYLRYSLGTCRSHEVYEVLGCTELDGGVSGLGGGKTFSAFQLAAASRALECTRGEWPEWIQQQEKEFFETLIRYAVEGGSAYINFA